MTLEEYFKWKGEAVEGLATDGHYRGCAPIAATMLCTSKPASE